METSLKRSNNNNNNKPFNNIFEQQRFLYVFMLMISLEEALFCRQTMGVITPKQHKPYFIG